MDRAPSPYFIPSPQSVVRNPQSLFYTDRSSISLIVDDRLWFHSVIQTGDLPSFFQILQIPMSLLLARDIKLRRLRWALL